MSADSAVVDDNKKHMPPYGRQRENKYKRFELRRKMDRYTKLNPDNIQMYQMFVPNTNIPQLKMKHMKVKTEMYCDSFYTNSDDIWDGSKMTLTGIIQIAHGDFDPTRIMDAPYSKAGVKYEFLRIAAGDWKFNESKVKKSPTPINKYRKDLLDDVLRSGKNGKRGDLCSFLTEITEWHQAGFYSRVKGSKLQALHGVHIKCNNCSCMSRIPWELMSAYVNFDSDKGRYINEHKVSKQQICHLIESFENRHLNDDEIVETSFKWRDDTKMMAPWMYESGSIDCYNCGWHISEMAKVSAYAIYTEKIFYPDYGINKMTLEEFEKCLMLDTPPPADLPMASQAHSQHINKEAARLLGRMQVSHINTMYAVSGLSYGDVMSEFTTSIFMHSQRLSELRMNEVEVEEIVLTREVASLAGGEILCHPSSLTIYHSLYDVTNALSDSQWFRETGISMPTHDINLNSVELLSSTMTQRKNLYKDGNIILHLNTNAFQDLSCVDGNYLTPVTGSDVPVKWDAEMCDMLSTNASITINDKKFKVSTVRSTSKLIISQLTEITPMEPCMRMLRGKSKIQVMLPTIDVNSIWQTLGIIGTKWKLQEIDTELVYRLLVNGLTGEKSMQSMMTYVAGLSSTRYAVGGQLVDLTNIRVKDGIPEMLYTMILLADKHRTMKWCQSNLVTVGANDLTKTIYDLILTKTTQLLKVVSPKTYLQLNDFMTKGTTALFVRDMAFIKTAVTASFDDIQPFIVLEDNMYCKPVNKTRICNHHRRRCNHEGDNNCKCCGVPTVNLDGYCLCCVPTNDDRSTHKCGHVCGGDINHRCETYNDTGQCSHVGICVCCKSKLCFEICKCCFDEEVAEEVEIKKSFKKFDKKLSNKEIKEKEDKSSKDMSQKPTRERKLKSTVTPGVMNKKLKIGEEVIKLKNISSVTKDELFFTSMEGTIHCFYNCMKENKTLSVEELTNIDVCDPVDVEKQCLMHCFTQQTNISMSDIMSVIGAGDTHSVKHIQELADYYNLNVIVQLSKTVAIMMRSGDMLDKYVMIAHSDALQVVKPRNVGHWFIPHKINLATLPNGLWNNVDYSVFNMTPFKNNDVFYMSQDELQKLLVKMRDFTTNSSIHNLTVPTKPKIDDTNGLLLSNGLVDNLVAGQVNIILPTKFTKLATDVFNTEMMTGEILSTTSFTVDVRDAGSIIEENIYSVLRELAVFYDGMRKSNLPQKKIIDISNAGEIVNLPASSKIFKALEYVQLQNNSGSSEWAMTTKRKGDVLVKNMWSSDLVRIITTKTSHSSLIRKLYILCKAHRNLVNFESLKITKIIQGVPGAGKTHWLRNTMSKTNTSYVSKFRRAMLDAESMNFNSCKTAEAQAMRIIDNDTLVIDEAAACDITEVIAMIDRPNMSLLAFGDAEQITTTDFSNTPGRRDDINTLSYFNEQVEKWNETYRFGEPLLTDVVKKIYPDIEKAPLNNTTTTYNVNKQTNLDDVIDYIIKTKFDLVICFHDVTFEYVQSRLNKTTTIKTNVVKVHADQGIEADNVAVLYWNVGDQDSITGILANKKYVNTATTRCKNNLEWITNIESHPPLSELYDHIQQGAGSSNSKLICTENFRLKRQISNREVTLLNIILDSKEEMIKSHTITQSSITLQGKMNDTPFNITIDMDGVRGNDFTTQLCLKMNKKAIKPIINDLMHQLSDKQKLFSETNCDDDEMLISINSSSSESVGPPDEITLRTSGLNNEVDMFHDALETNEEIDNMFTTMRDVVQPHYVTVPTMLCVKTYRLTELMWSRLIMLADASIIKTNACVDIRLDTQHGPMQVRAFNGCSLFCGFKFSWGKDDECVVHISSAHVENKEDLLSTMSCSVRSFVGDKDDIHSLMSVLTDPTETYITSMTKSSVTKRIIERIKIVTHSRVLTVSGKNANAGNYYEDENRSIYEAFKIATNTTQKIITHQKVSQLLFYNDGVIKLYPSNVVVTSFNDLLSRMKGITGVKDEPLNTKNMKIMDSIKTKRVHAEYSERKQFTIQTSVWDTWKFAFTNVINSRNVLYVNHAVKDDTIAAITGAIGINVVNKLLRLTNVDVKHIDHTVICLQGLEDFRSDITEMTSIEKEYNTRKVTTLMEGERLTAQNSTGVAKTKAVAHMTKIQQCGIFTRYGAMSTTLLVNITGDVSKEELSNYDTVYFMKIDNKDGYTMLHNKERYTVGDASEKLGNWYDTGNCVQIARVGPVTLWKYNIVVSVKTVVDDAVVRGVRRFRIDDTTLRYVDIPEEMFRKLSTRAMVEQVNAMDMLSYCRSMASTVVYSSAGYYRRYNVDYDELMLFVLVVMNIADRHRKFFDTVDVLWNRRSGNNTDELKSLAKSKFISMVSSVLTAYNIPEIINSYTDWIEKSNKLPKLVVDLINMVKDKHVTEITPFVKYMKISEEETNEIAKDDDDMEDDDDSEHSNDSAGKDNKDDEITELDEDLTGENVVEPMDDNLADSTKSFIQRNRERKKRNDEQDSKIKLRLRSAVKIQRAFTAYRANKCNDVHSSECEHCMEITRTHYTKINNVARDLFKKFDNYCKNAKLDYILCRGTVLACLYYGQTVYFQSNNENGKGFTHWVDGDHDVVIICRDKRPLLGVNKIFTELGKLLGKSCMYRANNDIGAFIMKGAYDDVDMRKNPTVHPHHEKRNKIMNHFCLDVGIVYDIEGVTEIKSNHMSEQLGISMGKYKTSDMLPTNDIGATYYGVKIMFPKNWWVCLSNAAMNYKDGDYKALLYPWFPGILTAGSARCANYNIREKWFMDHKCMLKSMGSVLPNLLDSRQTFPKLPRLKTTIAIVFAGSEGDHVPMRAVLDVIKEFANITIFKPNDVDVEKCGTIITYTASYKNWVCGGKEDKTIGVPERFESMVGTFDYVLAPFFSNEAKMLTATTETIWFHPLLVEDTSLLTAVKRIVTDTLLITTSKSISVQCVYSQLTPYMSNLGLPIRYDVLQVDENTHRCVNMYMMTKKKFNIVTFGSMRPDNFTKKLQLMVGRCTGPVIFVRGYSDVDTSLVVNKINYKDLTVRFTENFSVVDSLNYHVIAPYTKRVMCHGGAGTLQAFHINNVDVEIFPVAYDQANNAVWLQSQKKCKLINYQDEYNIFRKRVGELFDVTISHKAIVYPKVGIALVTRNIRPEDMKRKMSVCNLGSYNITKRITTRVDCVLLSAMELLGETSKSFKRFKIAYSDYTDQRVVRSVNDIVMICVLCNVNMKIVDCMVSRVITIGDDDKVTDKCMIVNENVTHADVGTAVQDGEFKDNSKVDLSSIWPGGDLAGVHAISGDIAKSLNGKVADTTMISQSDVNCLTSVRRLDISSRWKVLMRQRVTMMTPKFSNEVGYCSTQERGMQPWKIYMCITRVGVIYAVAVKTSDIETTCLYHGINEKMSIGCVIPINTMRDMNVTTKSTKNRGSVITAINNASLDKCRQLNIMVNSVCTQNSLELYIYSTWNRTHHLEKERECIVTARTIKGIELKMSEETITRLKKMRSPRCVLLRGEERYVIEPEKRMSNYDDCVLTNWLNSQSDFKMYSGGSIWICNSLTSASHAAKCLKLKDGSTDIHQYDRDEQKTWPMNTTLADLMGSLRQTIASGVSMTILEGLNMTTLDLSEINLTKITGVKFSCNKWAQANMNEYQLEFPYIILASMATIYIISQDGGAKQKDGLQLWNDQHAKIDGRFENKFNMKDNDELRDEEGGTWQVTSLTGLSNEFRCGRNEVSPELLSTSRIIEVVSSNGGLFDISMSDVHETASMKTIDYWDNFSELKTPTIHLPTTKLFKIKSRLEPVRVETKAKLRMEDYPDIARPSITTMFAAELNSVSTRQGSAKTHVSVKLNAKDEYEMFVIAFFKTDFNVLSDKWKQEQISISAKDTYAWIKKHNYPKFVMESLTELFKDGFEFNPINAIRVHGKVEQTTKLDKVSRWFDEVKSRSILASAYCISALFSPVFLSIKKRFKDALKPKFVYTDGMSPAQLNAHAKTFGDAPFIVEDDLSKQDASTTHLVIDIEMLIYESLGLDPGDLKLYSWIHMNWRWKGTGMAGVWDAMRLTGQPTTAIGNVITNMCVHIRLVLRNDAIIILMYVLGDDNIMYCKSEIDVKRHGTETKALYNIVSKVAQFQRVGQYLSMITHTLDGYITFCPNYKRLRHRFSVCNYSFLPEEREEKLQMRRLSYSLMLGNIKAANDFVVSLNVTPQDWFDVPSSIAANCLYYSESEEQTLNHLGILMKLMENTKGRSSKHTHFSSDLHRKNAKIDKKTLAVYL